MGAPHHSPEKKAEAIGLLVVHKSIRKAATAAGVPPSTLHRWVDTMSPKGVHSFVRQLITDDPADPHYDPPRKEVLEPENAAADVDRADATAASLDAEDPKTAQSPPVVPAENDVEPEPDPIIPEFPAGLPPFIPKIAQDPLQLQAFRRYVGAIANGAHPLSAMHVAQAVHPDFDLNAHEQQSIQDNIAGVTLSENGYRDLMLTLADPPAYVASLADQVSIKDEVQQELANQIASVTEDAYLVGLNDQLAQLGLDPVDSITDTSVLDQIQQAANDTASGIADTWNSDALNQVSQAWLDAQSVTLPPGDYDAQGGWAAAIGQARQDAMTDSVQGWIDDRSNDKSDTWASDASNNGYNQAVQDFQDNNGLADTGHVEPDDAVCQDCQDMVDAGTVDADTLDGYDLPAHPNCQHYAVYDMADPADATDLWTAQGDTPDELAMAEQIKAPWHRVALSEPFFTHAPSVAGLIVLAADTGRVLLIQRALDSTDPASGKWEYPGGHLENDETPIHAAMREWSEEVGQLLPAGNVTADWISPNGVWQGFVWQIRSEQSVPIHEEHSVLNPDDPDGDAIETAAWWEPIDLVGNAAIRSELGHTPWSLLKVNGPVAAAEIQLSSGTAAWDARREAAAHGITNLFHGLLHHEGKVDPGHKAKHDHLHKVAEDALLEHLGGSIFNSMFTVGGAKEMDAIQKLTLLNHLESEHSRSIADLQEAAKTNPELLHDLDLIPRVAAGAVHPAPFVQPTALGEGRVDLSSGTAAWDARRPTVGRASVAAAVRDYQSGSDAINDNLRRGGATTAEQPEVDALDRALASSSASSVPATGKTVYRGVDPGILGDASKLTGKVLTDRAFLSTTTNLKMAQTFGTTVLILHLPGGTPYLPISGGEHELLLPRDSQVRIDAVHGVSDDPKIPVVLEGTLLKA